MADAAFLALTVITIGSAIAALELRSLIYGSIALMGTLGGIAGFFFLLDSPFVALFQLAVYVGSIAVLILFTVMLVKRELIFKKIEDRRRKFAGNWIDVDSYGCTRGRLLRFRNKNNNY